MDAIIIFGTIPTLWPLLKIFSGKCIIRSRNITLYEQIQNDLDHEDGAEGFQLSDERPHRIAGPATRLLEEVDGMRTTITVTSGDQDLIMRQMLVTRIHQRKRVVKDQLRESNEEH